MPRREDLDGLDIRFLAPAAGSAFGQRTAFHPFSVGAARDALGPDSMTAQKRLIEAGIGIALSPESSTSADGGSNSRVLSQVFHESLFVDLARSVQGIVAVRVGLR